MHLDVSVLAGILKSDGMSNHFAKILRLKPSHWCTICSCHYQQPLIYIHISWAYPLARLFNFFETKQPECHLSHYTHACRVVEYVFGGRQPLSAFSVITAECMPVSSLNWLSNPMTSESCETHTASWPAYCHHKSSEKHSIPPNRNSIGAVWG